MNTATVSRVGTTQECIICGEGAAVLETREQRFAYGENQPVYLTAMVPVWNCHSCGEIYTADGAEEAQHDAVCDYLGRLRPSAIRTLRDQHHLSQDELAELTGIGTASIKRWETGALVQNEAMDRYLRLLNTPHNVVLLRAPRRRAKPVFQSGEPDAATLAAADRFSLRNAPVAAFA